LKSYITYAVFPFPCLWSLNLTFLIHSLDCSSSGRSALCTLLRFLLHYHTVTLSQTPCNIIPNEMANQTKTSYVRSGLGGAGNYRKVTSDFPSRPSTPIHVVHRASGVFTTGVGGFGNFHHIQDQPNYSPQEIAIRDQLMKENAATVWHYGIGGAGNHGSRAGSSNSSIREPSYEQKRPLLANSLPSNADKMKSGIAAKFESNSSRLSIFEMWQEKLPIYLKKPSQRNINVSSSMESLSSS